MVTTRHFRVGDLVWAKMKFYPFWPGKIIKPPLGAKSSAPKNGGYYVFFFGSENYAWIRDENIVHHSEEMLQAASRKKKYNSLKLAIKQITEVAPKKAKLLVNEKESPRKSAKVPGMKKKTESHPVRKEAVKKRRPVTNKRALRTRKSSKKSTERDNVELDNVVAGPTLNCHEPEIAGFRRPSNKKIGFIGLGKMGQTIVKRLLDSNYDVTIWNRTLKKCRKFVNLGAKIAKSPANLVEKCDIIFCRVSDAEASKNVVFGGDGILVGLERSPPGSKGYVEMTTMDSTTSIRIGLAITRKGGRYLEASVCGTAKMIENKLLLVLSAGDAELFAECENCFLTFAKNSCLISREVGCGSNMNIIYNMLISVWHAAFAEAISLVKHTGLRPDHFMQILQDSPSRSLLNSHIGFTLLSNPCPDDISAFMYHQKDLPLALSLGASCDQKLPVATMANEVFKYAKLHNNSPTDIYR